jgi:Ni/Co efflux regulator RcnB
MKKILIGTALAGMIVGTFTSLSFAAPVPARLDTGVSSNIVQVDARCGPHRHFIRGFRNRYGRWMPGHCVRNYERGRGYYR